MLYLEHLTCEKVAAGNAQESSETKLMVRHNAMSWCGEEEGGGTGGNVPPKRNVGLRAEHEYILGKEDNRTKKHQSMTTKVVHRAGTT